LLLAIDAGNTHIVFGLVEKGTVKKHWRIPTHGIQTGKSLRDRLIETLGSLENVDGQAIDGMALASVVPSVTEDARNSIQNDHLQIIDWKSPFSFEIKAAPADKIGIDRLVNAEAVIREHGAPCIVIDMGTATTICGISSGSDEERPNFLGGAIIPGLKLSMNALAQNTAQLFQVELTPPPSVIGSNTDEAIRSGVIYGYASMIDGMAQKFKSELKTARSNGIKVIATGGLSSLMKGISKEIQIYDPHLTLKGIGFLYETFLNR
jgi:type III pantothenate kinase